MKLALLLACVLLCTFGSVSQAQVPGVLNYQGRVAVAGVNFDGTGQFKFALVNAGGNVSHWSNDGTSTAGGQPAAAVSLPVTKGVYSLLLGDTSLANMTAVPASVFTNADVRLRVWFNDGVNGFQLLTPDQRLASTGYAMVAASAITAQAANLSQLALDVPDGSITQAKLGFAIGGGGGLPVGTQRFTTAGQTTFTVPAGITRLQVEVWGGGSGAVGSADVGVSGAGGGYSRTALTVTPGQVLTVYVGAGGAGNYLSTTSQVGSSGAGGASGVKNSGGTTLVESTGGGAASFNGNTGQAFPNSIILTRGAGGTGDANAAATREGGASSAGSTSNNALIEGGAVPEGSVPSGLATAVQAGGFSSTGFNTPARDYRRPHGTGGAYTGGFSSGGIAVHGFPGYVVLTW